MPDHGRPATAPGDAVRSPFALTPLRATAADAVAPDPAVPGWAAQDVITAGRRMDDLGFLPATAGNLSVRLSADRLAISRSGCHKGFLVPDDVIAVDLAGRPVCEGDRPSAETLLHCQIYDHDPRAGAVLHGHSVAATVLSRVMPDAIRLSGYEVQKVFAGQSTHDAALDVPVFDNDQDIPRLARRVAPYLADMRAGYVIRGHGIYVWGPDMKTAMARLEGLEFLLACVLQERSLVR